MDLRAYLRILRKNWWLVVACVLLGAGGAAAYNATTPRQYESDVTFYVSTPTDAAGGNAFQANQYAVAKIESYSNLVTSDALADRIIARAGLGLSPAQVASKLSADSDLNTVLVTVTVRDSDPGRSLQIAEAVAAEFGPLIDGLDNRTSESGVQNSTVKLVVTSGPSLKAGAVSPQVRTNISLGILAGLLVGLIVATLRGISDTTLRSIDALRAASGVPVLGAVGLDPAARRTPVLIGDQLRSIRAENYRQIRTNLQFSDVDKPVQVLIVTSSMAGEGKSSAAVNLAIVAAETGRKVLLVEADLRRPRAADYLGLESAVGLSNVLAGQVAVQDILQPWGTDGLQVLPSGSVPPNPSEMLGSQAMVNLLAELRTLFDLVIIDTPPLLPVTDAAVAATLADGVVVVVRFGKTTRNQLTASLYSLEAVDARILGCVLSMVPRKGAAATGYESFSYEEDDPTKRAAPLAPMATPRAAVRDVASVSPPRVDGVAPPAGRSRRG